MSLLRFVGKDPQGNAKGVSVDDDGNIMTNVQASSLDLLSSAQIGAENSVKTMQFSSLSNIVMVTLFQDTSGPMPQIIDAHWLDKAGNELSIDEGVLTFEQVFQQKPLTLKSPHFKLTVNNTHTDTRTITLTVTSMVGLDDFTVPSHTKELVRPKHTIIATKDLSIDANSSANTDTLIGTGNPYRNASNRFDVAEFAFIYFLVYRTTQGGGLRFTYEFTVRNPASQSDIISRSNYVGNTDSASNNVPGPRGVEAIAIESSSNDPALESDWIEVKGNSCRVNLHNDDDVSHDFRVAIMGIR